MENNTAAILEGLDSEQKKAVSCVDGPLLIVAGAGSGKTRVLTSRIAYIIAGGCPSERILALTFTKKAAGEMKERIAAMVGDRQARRISMGTFHSVFIRFLREFAEPLGYPREFTIYDQSDSISAVKSCLKELQLDDKVYKPKDVLSRISMAKNNLVTPGAYRRNTNAMQNDADHKKPRICDIYQLYWEKCRKAGVMDFDDILLNMNILFRDFPDALENIAARFDYILVDEYQDTNYAQYLVLKKICLNHHNICVVGDDSQSIYAFRGAKIENILNFQKDYPESRIFRLERNYRSTQTIVNAANSLIARNSSRIPKNCYSRSDEGEKINIIQAYTEQEEALQIVSSIIQRLHAERCEYQDFAILYRTNAQSRVLEEQLRRRNIPYVIYSGNSFFERAEVKDMMAYFKLVANPSDDESFKRIVNKPARGIGDTTLAAVESAARESGQPLFKAAMESDLAAFGLRTAAVDKLHRFCGTIMKYSARVETADAYEIAMGIALEGEYLPFLRSDTSIEGQSRTANAEELLNSVKEFVEQRHNEDFEQLQAEGGLASGIVSDDVELTDADLPVVRLLDFLENVSLLSNVDMESEEDTNNKVTMMTVHSSKGLEFPYVYIAGMEENLFPSGGMLASESEIEEERRLFYVALTRAQKAVALSLATTRMRNGQHESNSPSRFVREIDRNYFKNPLPDGTTGAFDDGEDDFEDWPSYGAHGGRSPYGYSSDRMGGYGSDRMGGYSSDRPGFRKSATASWNSRSGSTGQNSRFGNTGQITRSGVSKTDVHAQAQNRISVPHHVSSAVPHPVSRPVPPAVSKESGHDGFIPSPVHSLRAGMRVEHNRFGFGRIVEITGDATNLKAKVDFDSYGQKILLLNYAKLRVAD